MANNRKQQRFAQLCAAANKIVASGVNPSEVSGYAVSMDAFNRKPNGDFYTLFDEWLKQQYAVPGAPPVGMPAEASAQLEEWSNRLKLQIRDWMTTTVCGIASSFEQTTNLRVIALERLNADQARRYQEVVSTLKETEVEFDEAKDRIAALEKMCDELRNREQRLLGRIEQLTGNVTSDETKDGGKASTSKAAIGDVATDEPTDTEEVEASGNANIDNSNEVSSIGGVTEDRGSTAGATHAASLAGSLRTRVGITIAHTDEGLDDLEIADDDVAEDQNASMTGNVKSVPAADAGTDQPPAIATPPASGGQIEMPIVNDATADEADGDDVNRG